MAALQVVRYLGGVPIATTPSSSQRAALEDAGAATVLVPGELDTPLSTAIREATGQRGADLVLDANGGPEVEQLVNGCRPGASVIVHGGLSGKPTPLPAGGYAPVWLRRFVVFEVTRDPEALRRAEHFVRSGLAIGAFTPIIDRVFDFNDVGNAHRYVDSDDRAPGKPILLVRR
jgi:NADPH:quinone reductase-like Zn-dependent oxidoreductase